MPTHYRPAIPTDTDALRDLALAAFGMSEGPEIVSLIEELAADETARPLLSLVALEAGRIVGHVVFSRARLLPPCKNLAAAILAPLAVAPEAQSRGVGSTLVREGLRQLADAGVGLVFVLGHPGYYPRFGFAPAGRQGFAAPYPIAAENADAWMVLPLQSHACPSYAGQLACARALDDPKYWRE